MTSSLHLILYFTNDFDILRLLLEFGINKIDDRDVLYLLVSLLRNGVRPLNRKASPAAILDTCTSVWRVIVV